MTSCSGSEIVLHSYHQYNVNMSPTVFNEKGYRFFFFSREETRMHVHVHCAEGEARYWLEPEIELAKKLPPFQNPAETN